MAAESGAVVGAGIAIAEWSACCPWGWHQHRQLLGGEGIRHAMTSGRLLVDPAGALAGSPAPAEQLIQLACAGTGLAVGD